MRRVGCENLIVTCMDFRLHAGVQRVVRRFGGDGSGADIIRVAGAARNLSNVADSIQRQFLARQVALALSLHGVSRIVLVNHQDCGAYGFEGTTDPASEVAAHRRDLRAAAALLRSSHPRIAVETLFLNLDGTVETVA